MTAISHYGVLGMKWGVRRDQSVLDRLAGRRERKQNRKKAVTKAKAYAESVRRNDPTTRHISAKEFNALPKTPVKVAGKNTDLYRVAGKGNRKDLGDVTYVTKSKQDNDRYVALLAPDGGRSKAKFQMELKTSEALFSPSKRERIETFIETMSDEIPSPSGKSVMRGRDFVTADPVQKALSDHELGLQMYNRFAQTQVMRTPMHTKYFERIQAKGYNSLVDDADQGLFSEMPLIIFPQNSVSVSSVSKITKDQISDAQLNLKDVKD